MFAAVPMIIYLIPFPGLLNWMCFQSSRVLMSLCAIELGASAAAIGMVTVFLANSALMLGGGYAHRRGPRARRDAG